MVCVVSDWSGCDISALVCFACICVLSLLCVCVWLWYLCGVCEVYAVWSVVCRWFLCVHVGGMYGI